MWILSAPNSRYVGSKEETCLRPLHSNDFGIMRPRYISARPSSGTLPPTFKAPTIAQIRRRAGRGHLKLQRAGIKHRLCLQRFQEYGPGLGQDRASPEQLMTMNHLYYPILFSSSNLFCQWSRLINRPFYWPAGLPATKYSNMFLP